jgi:rhamnosyltransferase
MNPSPNVCAVVVTFHPDGIVLHNLAAVRPQVQHLIVVDNGSTDEELIPLRSASSTLNFNLLENGENLGIASALNLGIHRGEALGANWFLLLDQDGCVTENYTATMLQAFAASPSKDRLAILAPRLVDRRFGHTLAPPTVTGAQLQVASTSGTLTPLRIFERAGYFRDELFIDGVDTDYSLRVRSLDYTVEECTAAILLHSPGTPSYHRFFFRRKPFQSANYSPIRRYYQERNKIWVARHFWPRFRPFLLSQFKLSLIDFTKMVLVEDNKAEKSRFFLRGILDGLRNHLGKLKP